MGRLSATLARICNLRTAAVLIALWLLVGGNSPAWFNDFAARIDRTIFRLGLYASQLPVPRTSITVAHVPALEYERWLADLPGATGLQKIFLALDKLDPPSQPLVGLVLEQPLGLIQPEAESVLAEIQRGRRRTDHFYNEARELLQRREYLMEQLKSERVILGLLDHVPSQFRPLEVSLGQLAELPPWLLPWLQQSPPGAQANTASPVLHYLPIPLNESAKQYMALQAGDQYLPSFWAQFMAASAIEPTAPDTDPSWVQGMFWRQDKALMFGPSSVPLGSDAGFVPIYGAMSGIRSSLRQISLDAALSAESLGDWLLIGRDGDVRLERVAQVLASLGNGAIVAEPWWWPAVEKGYLLLSALLLSLLVPMLPWRSTFVLTAAVIGVAVAVQISGQSLAGLWLPSGVIASYCLLAFALLWVWRWQRSITVETVARADRATLALAKNLTARGDLDRAYDLTTSCRNSPSVLEQIYQISVRYEEHGHFAKAWRSLHELKRRKRKYKDVPTKLKRIKSLALSQSVQLPVAAEAKSRGRRAGDSEISEASEQLIKTQKLAAPSAPPKPMFGRYEVLKELGRGASGTVFLGYDPLISREVAIKTLSYQQFSGAELADVKARFLREAEAAGRLSHPNIVPVFDVGEQDSCAYIAMDFAKGQALSAFTTREHLLPAFEVYRIVLDIAEALAYAHEKKIVHRDIKPGNVLYCRDPHQVKVTDFGIARFIDHSHTRTGEILGSPLYMAPEQVLGGKVEASADVFSLGTVFYQLLCGQLPFNGDSLAAVSYDIVHSKQKSVRAENRALPASAARITNVALQKKPAERYASARAMAEALRKAIRRDFAHEAKVAGLVV